MTLRKSIFKKLPNLALLLAFYYLMYYSEFISDYISLPVGKLISFTVFQILKSLTFLFLFLIFLPELVLKKIEVRKNNKEYWIYLSVVLFTISISSASLHRYLLFPKIGYVKIFLVYLCIHLIEIIILKFTSTFSKGSRDQNFKTYVEGTKLRTPAVSSDNPSSYIVLIGRLKGDRLKINIENLYFIKSCDNYCEIKYLDSDNIKIDLFRVSLKELENQILSDFIIKVHKSYILNLNYVSYFEGNINNTKAHLKLCDTKIAIARSKRDFVKEKYKKLTMRDKIFIEHFVPN